MYLGPFYSLHFIWQASLISHFYSTMNCVILTILSHFSSDRLRFFFSIINKCIYINFFFTGKKNDEEKNLTVRKLMRIVYVTFFIRQSTKMKTYRCASIKMLPPYKNYGEQFIYAIFFPLLLSFRLFSFILLEDFNQCVGGFNSTSNVSIELTYAVIAIIQV